MIFLLIGCKSWIGEWLLLKLVWIHFIDVCICVIVYEVWKMRKLRVLVKNEHNDDFSEN